VSLSAKGAWIPSTAIPRQELNTAELWNAANRQEVKPRAGKMGRGAQGELRRGGDKVEGMPPGEAETANVEPHRNSSSQMRLWMGESRAEDLQAHGA
jgi:hypothetical protein